MISIRVSLYIIVAYRHQADTLLFATDTTPMICSISTLVGMAWPMVTSRWLLHTDSPQPNPSFAESFPFPTYPSTATTMASFMSLPTVPEMVLHGSRLPLNCNWQSINPIRTIAQFGSKKATTRAIPSKNTLSICHETPNSMAVSKVMSHLITTFH